MQHQSLGMKQENAICTLSCHHKMNEMQRNETLSQGWKIATQNLIFQHFAANRTEISLQSTPVCIIPVAFLFGQAVDKNFL